MNYNFCFETNSVNGKRQTFIYIFANKYLNYFKTNMK